MTASTVAVIGALIFGWAVLSGALARRNVTGPLVFAAAGYLLCNPDWGPVPVDIETASIHVVAEAALALVLFSDAARVNLRELRSDIGLPVRLLGIGLPLSVILGGVLAAALLLDLPWALAGFLGAALAPTDAALSVQVINDKRIPMRIRRGLNVESGLNDGIATPIVTVMLAIAASQLGIVSESPSYEAGFALRDLVVGAAVGAAIGIGGAATIAFAARRGWTASAGRRLAALALAFSAYTVAIAIHGNGFIAAFVAGIAFGATLADEVSELDPADELPELGGELLALVVWFLFGAALLPAALSLLDVRIAAYALLSLTVVRMIPVFLCTIRSGLDRPTIMFIAWFGPRGLASVVFALLAFELLGENSTATNKAVAALTFTVLLSIILHGFTAGPGGRRYVQLEAEAHPSDAAPRARSLRFIRGAGARRWSRDLTGAAAVAAPRGVRVG